MGKKFVKIKSRPNGVEECIFCARPSAGELEASFEAGESADVGGVRISVCDGCAEKKGPTIRTFI